MQDLGSWALDPRGWLMPEVRANWTTVFRYRPRPYPIILR